MAHALTGSPYTQDFIPNVLAAPNKRGTHIAQDSRILAVNNYVYILYASYIYVAVFPRIYDFHIIFI